MKPKPKDRTDVTVRHTPGPWSLTIHPHDKGIFEIKKIDLQLVDSLAIDTAEQAANARLIAAAPEMFELLNEFINGEDIEWNADYLEDFAFRVRCMFMQMTGEGRGE